MDDQAVIHPGAPSVVDSTRTSTPFTVAYLEDDTAQQAYVSSKLERHHYRCHLFSTAHEMKQAFKHTPCDIALLDWDLGAGGSGLEVVKHLRNTEQPGLPIIVLSARRSIVDMETILNAGANDYLHKPVTEADLLCVMDAHLRRSDTTRKVNVYGCYEDNTLNRTFSRQKKPFELTGAEYTIVSMLFRSAGRLITNTALRNALETSGYDSTTRIESQVHRLKKKIRLKEEASAFRLEPVHGCGYRLIHKSPIEYRPPMSICSWVF